MMLRLFIPLLGLVVGAPELMGQTPPDTDRVVIARRNEVPLWDRPEEGARTLAKVARGRRLTADGTAQNGFLRIRTRSQRTLWVRQSDVREETATDVVADLTPPAEDEAADLTFRRWRFDLGASAGSVGDINYSEANLGVNYFFTPWLAWRNAGFYRFVSQQDDVYGLDSSARAIYRTDLGTNSGVTLFGGPGARFPNEGDVTPFGEVGLIARLFGFTLGFGVKSLFTTWVNKDIKENDIQYFVILGGSASL